MGIALICAVLSGIIGFYMATSRLLYSMSREKALPAWFGKIEPKSKTPKNAILFIMAISPDRTVVWPRSAGLDRRYVIDRGGHRLRLYLPGDLADFENQPARPKAVAESVGYSRCVILTAICIAASSSRYAFLLVA